MPSPRSGLSLALVVLCTLALAVSAAAAASSGSTTSQGRFTSSQYGYSLALPPGWSGAAASERFPGGDIDHTAPYADSFSTAGDRLVFALGRGTKQPLLAFARAHGTWLVRNRPCRLVGTWRKATLAGEPARAASFACDSGVFGGPTFVAKWVVVRRGLGIVFTQFTPDGARSDDSAALKRFLRRVAWARA